MKKMCLVACALLLCATIAEAGGVSFRVRNRGLFRRDSVNVNVGRGVNVNVVNRGLFGRTRSITQFNTFGGYGVGNNVRFRSFNNGAYGVNNFRSFNTGGYGVNTFRSFNTGVYSAPANVTIFRTYSPPAQILLNTDSGHCEGGEVTTFQQRTFFRGY